MRHPAPPRPQQVEFLLDLYRHALAAADPMKVLPPHLPEPPRGRTVVVGMGKAAAAMARAVEQHWRGPLGGVVVVPPGASLPLERIELIEGRHPVPDERSVAAGEVNHPLRPSAAPSRGRHRRTGGAGSAVSLGCVGSCVVGGAKRNGSLVSGALESPKPQDPRFAGHLHAVIACAQDGLDAAAEAARRQGWKAHVLSDSMEGEARELAMAHAAIAIQVQRRGQPFEAPCVLLSAGEATVTVNGQGRGGRNTEFALALAIALGGRSGIHALSAGTDGLDGNSGAAGAWISPATLQRARACARTPQEALLDNDSGSFFEAVDGLVSTGPTLTNINDFRAVIVEAA